MATSKLDRVKSLIAQATDVAVSEEEARTFALIACKMIRQHGYVVAESVTVSAPSHGYGSTPGGGVRINIEDIGDIFGGKASRRSKGKPTRSYVAGVSSGDKRCEKCNATVTRGLTFWTLSDGEVRCGGCVFLR